MLIALYAAYILCLFNPDNLFFTTISSSEQCGFVGLTNPPWRNVRRVESDSIAGQGRLSRTAPLSPALYIKEAQLIVDIQTKVYQIADRSGLGLRRPFVA